MVQGCPLKHCRSSHCPGKQQRAVGQRLGRITRRAATSSGATLDSTLPFGGAIVTKLAGSTKIAKGEHQRLVPLLGPGDGPQPRLPFGASLECFNRQTSAMNDSLSQHPNSFAPQVASARPHATTRPSILPSNSDAASSSFPSAASSQMLDVLYVLAGSGTVRSADGSVRQLHAGDSLVAWHNTTELQPHPAASPSDPPPAVLKFHFPASVLMLPPGATVAPIVSHTDLAVLVSESQQGHLDGQLSPQEADDMLSGVRQRAARAIVALYDQQQPELSEVAGEVAGEGCEGADAPRTVAAAPASLSAGALLHSAVLPALRGLQGAVRGVLREAAAPAAGGIRLLRSALTARSRRHPAPAHARPSAGPSPAHVAASAASTAVAAPGPQLQGAGAAGPTTGCVLLQRALEEFKAFRFPRQTNKLAFVFDPSELGLSLSFGVEVFEPGHRTPLHIHKSAHELFFVLAGEGVAACNGQRFPVRAGDCVVFPPRAVHGIDNTTDDKLYCLQLMTPNEAFVEHVKSGEAVGRLDDEDLCNLTSRHC